jgi:hypothetical protein
VFTLDPTKAFELRELPSPARVESLAVIKQVVTTATGWQVDDLYFTCEFPVTSWPVGFALQVDEVTLQVVVRLVPITNKSEVSVKGLNLFYRYRRTIVSKTPHGFQKRDENEEIKETRSVDDCFVTDDVVEVTNWRGLYLERSSHAQMLRNVLSSIGRDKVNQVLRNVTAYVRKDRSPKRRDRRSP